MSRVAYVDGSYVPHRLATVHIEDRGYQFSDGVYEAKAASEAFLTSTAVDLLPVVRIDGEPIGEGRPGPLSRRLREAYLTHAAAAS